MSQRLTRRYFFAQTAAGTASVLAGSHHVQGESAATVLTAPPLPIQPQSTPGDGIPDEHDASEFLSEVDEFIQFHDHSIGIHDGVGDILPEVADRKIHPGRSLMQYISSNIGPPASITIESSDSPEERREKVAIFIEAYDTVLSKKLVEVAEKIKTKVSHSSNTPAVKAPVYQFGEPEQLPDGSLRETGLMYYITKEGHPKASYPNLGNIQIPAVKIRGDEKAVRVNMEVMPLGVSSHKYIGSAGDDDQEIESTMDVLHGGIYMEDRNLADSKDAANKVGLYKAIIPLLIGFRTYNPQNGEYNENSSSHNPFISIGPDAGNASYPFGVGPITQERDILATLDQHIGDGMLALQVGSDSLSDELWDTVISRRYPREIFTAEYLTLQADLILRLYNGIKGENLMRASRSNYVLGYNEDTADILTKPIDTLYVGTDGIPEKDILATPEAILGKSELTIKDLRRLIKAWPLQLRYRSHHIWFDGFSASEG